MELTDRDVEEILRLLESSQYQELSLTTDRFKLILRRTGAGGGGWTEERQTLAPPHVTPLQASRSGTPGPAERAAAQAPASSVGTALAGLSEVRAPIMGTFYRAPKPGAAAFVEVGTQVSEETVVGIVETMKLMNSVYAGARGQVLEIRAANGELVEQHALLMLLKPESA
ncbi:MAG TPA: biotin/lipoyl-containing protein [Steroidobacteraceae bacterium]|nr:biotin/lipoyl-containing protein [Steroidobacteraceae bacterium]